MLKVNFINGIKNKRFLITIFIGIGILILGIYNQIADYLFIDFSAPDIADQSGFAQTIYNDIFNKYSLWGDSLTMFMTSIPLLCAIAYTTSFRDEISCGMNKFINTRISNEKYTITKLITSSLIGGLSVLVPVIIVSALIFIIFNGEINNSYLYGAYGGMYVDLFNNNFMVYFIMHLGIVFLMGASYSTIALAVSTKTKNIIGILLSPLIFYLVISIVYPMIGTTRFSPERIFQFYENPTVPLIEILISLAIVYIISSLVFLHFSKKEFIYESSKEKKFFAFN